MTRGWFPWWRRDEAARDVREELDAHVQLQIDELVAAGLSPREAEEEARRRFGDRGGVERELLSLGRRRARRARRLALLTDLAGDARLALRQLARQRLFALGVIAVIGLGVGATTAVFSVVDAGFFRPLPFPDDDALVYLWDDQGDGERIGPSLPEFRDWRRDADFVSATVAIHGASVRWDTGGPWEVLLAGGIEGDLGRVAGTAPLLGRWISPDEIRAGERVAMIDEATWRARFAGRREVIGETLRLDAGPYTIVGVAPRSTSLLRADGESGAVALWLPLVERPDMERGTHFLRVVARLKDGVTPESARPATALLAERLRLSGVTRHGITVEAARPVLVGGARPVLYALAGAALLVLFTVCANLGNLFLWKSLARSRELAVRAALGATRPRLVRQVLAETVVVALCGGVAGVLLSYLFLGVTRGVVERAGALAPRGVDLRIVAFAVLISVVVGLLFGSWPALRASRVDLAEALRDGAHQLTASGTAARARKLLVAVEVALGVVLLTGTGLLVRSMVAMLSEDPGFRPAQVLAVRLNLGDKRYDDEARIAAFYEQLRARMRAVPGVVIATEATQLPLERSDTSGSFEVVGRTYTDDDRPGAKKRVVGPGYFEAMGIPIVAGRGFRDGDRAGAPDVVVISQAVARRHFPGEDAVGKRIRFSWGPGEEQEIVGVVGDVHHVGLDQPVDPTLYRPAGQFPNRALRFILRLEGETAPALAALRREVAALDSTVPVFDVRTLDDVVASWTAPRRGMIAILGVFAAIAALLAAVGAYAVTAQMVTSRTREIGLRMACGARPADILGMVAREGAVMIGGGVLLGVGVALAGARVLGGMLYGVTPHDPVALGVAVGLLALFAALAILLPARRAARLDVMDALR